MRRRKRAERGRDEEMEALFLQLLNMSIAAGYLILAVLLLRLILRRAPKAVRLLLWGLVAFRLACPFSLESVLSLIPSGETVPQTIIVDHSPAIDSGIPLVNQAVNPLLSGAFAPEPVTSANPMQIVVFIASLVWLAGMVALAGAGLLGYIRLRWRVADAVRLRENIWQTDAPGAPFVLGLFRPRIYLPFSLAAEDEAAVIAHEQAHIRRKDPWLKLAGYLFLAVYWFHPLVWAAYICFCRDIELCCDERVIRQAAPEMRRTYSQALLRCAAEQRRLPVCPLAFGEVGVKQRIKNVLDYRRPTMWAMTAAVAAIAAAAVFFLTNPLAAATSAGERVGNLLPGAAGSDVSGMEMRIIGCDLAGKDQTITVEWKNGTRQDTTFGKPFALYRWEEEGWVSCRRPDRELVFTSIGLPVAAGQTREHTYAVSAYFDLSRAGKYRLETDFFFDKDIPIEEKDTRRIWVEFELVNGREATIQGVTLRITGLGDKGLETQWINRSGREFAFGEAFRITRWEAGAWVDCPKPGTEAYFNSIAWLVPDGGEADKTYSLEYWDVSRPGTYRLETEDHAGGPFRVEFQVPFEPAGDSGQTWAIQQAKGAVTVSYDSAEAVYDPAAECWRVHFYTRNQVGGDQTVYLDREGRAERSEYGE